MIHSVKVVNLNAKEWNRKEKNGKRRKDRKMNIL